MLQPPIVTAMHSSTALISILMMPPFCDLQAVPHRLPGLGYQLERFKASFEIVMEPIGHSVGKKS